MDFKTHISNKISEIVKELDADSVYKLLEIPKDESMGDIAFPCFTLSKLFKKAPNIIASDFACKISTDEVIEKAAASGGYLNFFYNRNLFVSELTDKVLKASDNYGKSCVGSGKTVIVEYSSPNIAKPFHIGHLFSTAVGSSLSAIYSFLGYKVERINHLGDWGTQFGKLICAYKMWGDKETVEKDPINELLKLYVRFHEEAKANTSLDDDAREAFRLLEEGDEENTALWNWFRSNSLEEFKRVYAKLGVGFDSYNGEAFYSDKMDAVVSELKEKNLLTESEGAMIVTFDDMPPAIILKQDGSTIYATRDLAAAIYRKNTYNFYKNIYVVGLPQTLHFKQIFATLKKMGKDFADDCIHVGFGTVKFPDRAMSTRNGDVVLLETVIDEAVKKTGEIMKENGNINNIDEVASKVGIGAIFYTFLKNSREKDIIFQWDDILDFNGESGPYVQYSYARGMSVLSKADNKVSAAVFDYEITDEEYTLSKLISEFAQVVIDAANKNEPFYITRYVTNVAKAFNKFYNTSPILKAEENIKNARLALTKASCITIKNALSLLGIEVVNKM